jgi:transposase-like protein
MTFTHKYTLEQRQEVVNLYVAYGNNSKQASKKSGIPAPTIRAWTQTKWWAEMVEETVGRHKKKMDGKLTHVMDQAIKQLLDRVQNGDEKVNAKGEPSRVKMSGKDLMYVLGMSSDKRDAGRLSGFQEKKKSMESVIQAQQMALEDHAKRKKAIEAGELVELNVESKEASTSNS